MIKSIVTKSLKTGLAIKNVADKFMTPVKTIRDFIKKLVTKTIVNSIKFIVKSSIDKTNTSDSFVESKISSNLVIKQLNALVDPNADKNGISKKTCWRFSLDTFLENKSFEQELQEYTSTSKVYGYAIELRSKLTQGFQATKSFIRQNLLEYAIENDFENLNTIIETVNEIISSPTAIAGCRFARVDIVNTAVVYNDENKPVDFAIDIEIEFCLSST